MSGTAALMPGAVRVRTDPLSAYLVALAGTATLAVVTRSAGAVRDDMTGLIASALLAVAILHVRESHFAMTDTIMTLLVVASLAVLLRGVDQQQPARRVALFAAAGALGGLAASTKYTAAAVLAAMGAAHLLTLRRPWRSALSWRAWQPSLVFALCFACGFLLATPYAVLDFPAFKEGIEFNVWHMRAGQGVPLGRGFTYHLTNSLPYGLVHPRTSPGSADWLFSRSATGATASSF